MAANHERGRSEFSACNVNGDSNEIGGRVRGRRIEIELCDLDLGVGDVLSKGTH